MKWFYKSLLVLAAVICCLAGILYFGSVSIDAQQGRAVGRVFLYFVHNGRCAHAYSLTSEQFRSSRPYLLFCSDVYKIQRLSQGSIPYRASNEALNESFVFSIGSEGTNAWSARNILTYTTGVRAEESINVVYANNKYTVGKFYFVQQEGVWASNSGAEYALSDLEQRIIQDVKLKIANPQATEAEFQSISMDKFTEETLNITERIANALSQRKVPEDLLNGKINDSIQRVFSVQWDTVKVVGTVKSTEESFDRISFLVLSKITEKELEENFSMLLFFKDIILVNILIIPADFTGDNAYYYSFDYARRRGN